MNYIDSGNSLAQKSFARKTSKKTSLFYQQAQKDKEEERYVKDVDELQIFKDNEDLKKYRDHFKLRNDKFFETIEQVIKLEGSLMQFSKGNSKFGFQVSDTGITYREYAPGAKALYLFGEFTNQDKKQLDSQKDHHGVWELFLPRNEKDSNYPINEDQTVQVHLQDVSDNWVDRYPLWATSTRLGANDQEESTVWMNEFEWKNSRPGKPNAYRVKEIQTTQTFTYVTENILPKLHQDGLNAILLKRTNTQFIFAPNCRQGNLNDFRTLVDAAHHYGVSVLLEVNFNNYFFPDLWDGTEVYGQNGRFDFSKWETLRLLLSNIRWWLDQQVDGFVIQDIGQIIYPNQDLQKLQQDQSFQENSNIDSLIFLMLANDLVKQISENVVTIAQDNSGYPTLYRTLRDGGIGFDVDFKNLSFTGNISMTSIPEEEVKQ